MLSSKQQEYLKNCSHRWNIKIGATGSGKSWLDYAVVIPKRLISMRGEGAAVMLGNTQGTANRNILEPMRDIWGESLVGMIGSDNKANLFGRKVYVLGADNKKHVARIQGMTIEYAYGDEMTTWEEAVFQMLKSRLRCHHSFFDGTANPDTPSHFIKKFIDSDVDIFCQTSTIFDNPFLPKEFVENLCKEYEGTIYYDRFILGHWKRAEGAIYRRYADNPESYRRPADIEHLNKIIVGVDFGGNKSGHSFVATGKYKNGCVQPLLSRRYMNKDYPQGIDAQILSDIFLEFLDELIEKYGMPEHVYWDNAETVLGQTIKNACKGSGLPIKVVPALKKRIKDRIDHTVRLMGAGLFCMTDDCETLSEALKDAVWNPKSEVDERLDDGTSDIDTLDAFEYTIERDITTKATRRALMRGVKENAYE